MLQYLFFITSIGFFLWVFRNILFWVELWQSKEYRLDRLLVHINETMQGKKLLLSPVSFIKWLLILAYGLVIFNDSFTFFYICAVCLLYVGEGLFVISEMVSGYKLRRPIKTVKALAIVLLSLVITVLLYAMPLIDAPVWFVIVDRLVILVMALFVFFFAFPTEIYIDLKIQRAKQLIHNHKNLIVIAVSGSYGKSSTKEFIAQILKEKYNVVKTIGSNNTPIGVANTILSQITDATQVFVVEMGAYKKGEVAELCDMVPPTISVTTSVSDQHLSLFGSLQNAIDTELELINALPKKGLALFNGNNENTAKLYEKTKKQAILYTSLSSHDTHLVSSATNIFASNVLQTKEGISFDGELHNTTIHFKTALLGEHMVENILPGIYIADFLHVSQADIKKAVASLIPPAKTMAKKILPNGVTVIDDTFNASPESVEAAIRYLRIYKKTKMLVLMPLVELGKHAKERHYEIGKHAARTCDFLFVTNKNFYYQIKKGITDAKGTCRLIYKKPPELVKEIISLAQKDDVVVFEGKEAGRVLQQLI